MTKALLSKTKDPFGISDFFGASPNDLFGLDYFQFDYPLKDNPSYPPYNIVRSEDGNEYQILMAVAGLDKNDIDVTVSNNKLTVSYEATETKDEENQTFIHRGIAKRSFKSTFRLPKNSEISDCSLTNGMLSITIEKYDSKDDDFKKIEIS